jgi:biotin operon repressor
MTKKQRLTEKQKAVWKALESWIRRYDIVPTHEELAKKLGCARTTVTVHLATLEQKGYIKRSRNWRDLEIVDDKAEDASLEDKFNEWFDRKLVKHKLTMDDLSKRYHN